MSTLAHTAAHPTLRLLERRLRPADAPAPVPPPAAPALTARIDHWLTTLPEPRNRLGAATHV